MKFCVGFFSIIFSSVLHADRNQTEAIQPLSKRYHNDQVFKKTLLDWTLISSGFNTSRIAVTSGDQLLGEYQLNCDVSESFDPDLEVLEDRELEGELNKIGLIQTPSQPQGLLLSSCRFGAHSKMLSVYDLKNQNKEPIWQKTGSYYAQWSLNEYDELVLSYDFPCTEINCAVPFLRRDVLWSEIK